MIEVVKQMVIKKVIIVALIVVVAIILGVIGNFLAVPATEINAEASFEVMKGNSTTVQGMAAHGATGGFLAIGRLACIVIIFILSFTFAIDTWIDIKKLKKLNEQEETKKEESK